jgi:DNA replication factor GINS
MYDELYKIWRCEFESVELTTLSPDFYSRIADYLRSIKKESRMLDKRTVKARLLKSEMQKVKRMVRELIRIRYGKLVTKVTEGEKIPSDILTVEEERIYTGLSRFAEVHRSFAKSILRGQVPKNVEQKNKRVALRFFKAVPAIIGADMETYGPFRVEDVASLPIENAKILVKQGLAEKIEVN